VNGGAAGRLEVEMGSLYPPEEHPFFAMIDGDQRARLSRHLRVILDGEVLLDSYQRFHVSSPADVALGKALHPGGVERAFSGQITRARAEDFATRLKEDTSSRRAVRLRLADGTEGKKFPLFTVGGEAWRSVWYVVARSDGRLAIGCARQGVMTWETEAVSADLATTHEIEVTTITGPGQPARVVVRLDHVIIGTRRRDVTGVGLLVALAANEPALPGIERAFAGVIHRADEDREVAEFDAVNLSVMFPVQRGREREPLVVTGETGRGDFLFVEYLNEKQIRFGLDHWGKATVFSEPLASDLTAPHTLEIALESFPDPTGRPEKEPRRLSVTMDGRVVWAQEAKLFAVTATDVFVGRNPIGGTGCAPLFTGAILEVKRVRKPDSVR
jgi:hypothetical protein